MIIQVCRRGVQIANLEIRRFVLDLRADSVFQPAKNGKTILMRGSASDSVSPTFRIRNPISPFTCDGHWANNSSFVLSRSLTQCAHKARSQALLWALSQNIKFDNLLISVGIRAKKTNQLLLGKRIRSAFMIVHPTTKQVRKQNRLIIYQRRSACHSALSQQRFAHAAEMHLPHCQYGNRLIGGELFAWQRDRLFHNLKLASAKSVSTKVFFCSGLGAKSQKPFSARLAKSLQVDAKHRKSCYPICPVCEPFVGYRNDFPPGKSKRYQNLIKKELF